MDLLHEIGLCNVVWVVAVAVCAVLAVIVGVIEGDLFPAFSRAFQSRPILSTLSTIAAVFMSLFMFFVWPTPYRYDHLRTSGHSLPVRINRFTGRAEWLNMRGWQPMQPMERKARD